MNLVILKNTTRDPEPGSDTRVVSFDEVKRWVLGRAVFSHLGRWDSVELWTYRADLTSKPLVTALVARALSRGPAWIVSDDGARLRVTAGLVLRRCLVAVRDALAADGLRGRAIAATEAGGPVSACASGPPLYLRTDLAFAVRSGGSVGHIAGVVNNFAGIVASPVFVTSDEIPTVSADVETHVVTPVDRHREDGEMWALAYSEQLRGGIERVLAGRMPSFVYQRYSLNNFAGLEASRRLDVPFVLEYNGSEVWMARHWGRPLRREALAERIELANLRGAALVVVVSEPMRDELVERGIPAAKVLVNPNGVDPQRYAPDVDGSAVREALGLGDRTVIGFIGTFGRWHGAEVLAEAYGRLLARRPALADTTRLLMVGDGATMPEVREAVERHGIGEQVVLTGLVPQEQGPAHLAAMDVLASPHVPNPDGTPFFGSPTKLFEYMAMGRGIVASDLDQIGEVLEHDVTAWMVEPGDADALVDGLAVLIDDPARRTRLGDAARREVLARYTWREHTRRIVEALEARCT